MSRPASAPPATIKPVVLVPACNRTLGDHPFHVVGKKYIDAVRLAGCQPLVVPDAAPDDWAGLLDLADGIFLTGSRSNVHPRHFDEPIRDPGLPLDPDRDAWVLPLIALAIERGLPLFGVCRGLQETNIALGGSLHQAVHEVPDRHDHRAAADASAEVQYGPAHDVVVQPGGLLEELVGQSVIRVNSVHGQGVKRLAEGLRVEALAPDGLVEAFSMPGACGFNLCVQWHPEWRASDNAVSLRLFRAFGEACASYRDRRGGPEPDR